MSKLRSRFLIQCNLETKEEGRKVVAIRLNVALFPEETKGNVKNGKNQSMKSFSSYWKGSEVMKECVHKNYDSL